MFAIPTYGFVVVRLRDARRSGSSRVVRGRRPGRGVGRDRHPAREQHVGGLLLVALVLRAFASGCTALTGVEAVSNGVPNFKKPKSRNAAATLAIMGVLTVAMFAGITALALVGARARRRRPGRSWSAPRPATRSAPSSPSSPAAVFGDDSVGFFAVQAFTAAILVLAANTAFNGFPILASILGQDGFLPRQFARRGDRLVFSNGIVILAVLAGRADLGLRRQHHPADPALHHRRVRLLHPQPGRAWSGTGPRLLRARPSPAAAAVGCAGRWPSTRSARSFTALVLVVVLVTKFTHGAWIVVIAMPAAVRPDDRHPPALRPGRRRAAAQARAGCCCPAGSTPSCWSPSCTPRPCGPSPTPGPPARTP